jgi:hypothetical protein
VVLAESHPSSGVASHELKTLAQNRKIVPTATMQRCDGGRLWMSKYFVSCTLSMHQMSFEGLPQVSTSGSVLLGVMRTSTKPSFCYLFMRESCKTEIHVTGKAQFVRNGLITGLPYDLVSNFVSSWGHHFLWQVCMKRCILILLVFP